MAINKKIFFSKEYENIKSALCVTEYKVLYSNTDYTKHHKLSILEAFKNILEKDPNLMIQYLYYNKKGLGIQNKIFKEYIKNIESKIIITFKKGKQHYTIKSLLDPNLGIFSGQTIFVAKINKLGIINNNTQEIYVGSRSQPYYIGKLMDVIDLDTKQSLMDYVLDYNFNKIYMDKTIVGKKVNVVHLMMTPHYQIGAMSYLNRLRKDITDILESIK